MKKNKGFGESNYFIWIILAVIFVAFHTYSVFQNNLDFNPLVFITALIFILLAYVFKKSKILNYQPIIRIKNESALAAITFNVTIITAGPLLFRWLNNPNSIDPYIDYRFTLSIAFLSFLSTVFLIVNSLKDETVL
jgi:hypothetical protein